MGTTIYHVTQTPDEYMGFRVFVNGKEAPLNCARVSAVPFNRRWPGYQRQKSQTEMINFLSFATDEEVFIEVIPLSPFEDVVIRPLSLGIKPDVTDGKISFKLNFSKLQDIAAKGMSAEKCNPNFCKKYAELLGKS